MTAPVTSGDERVFVLPHQAFSALPDRRALEQVLQELLKRKVWIVEESETWRAAAQPLDGRQAGLAVGIGRAATADLATVA